MEVDIIITIAMATALIVIVNQFSRIVRARMLHRTIREALSRDSNVTPELLDRIEQDKATSFGDGRIGLVLVAIAAAIFILGLLMGDPDDIRESAGIAVFPLFVGGALLGRLWYLRRRGEIS